MQTFQELPSLPIYNESNIIITFNIFKRNLRLSNISWCIQTFLSVQVKRGCGGNELKKACYLRERESNLTNKLWAIAIELGLTHLYNEAKMWRLKRSLLTEQKEFKLSPSIAFVFFELSLNFGVDSFLFFLFLRQTARHFVGQGLHTFLMHSIAYTYIYIYILYSRTAEQAAAAYYTTHKIMFRLRRFANV